MAFLFTDIVADGLFCSDVNGTDHPDLAAAIVVAERGLIELAGTILKSDRTVDISASIRDETQVVASMTLSIACRWSRLRFD